MSLSVGGLSPTPTELVRRTEDRDSANFYRMVILRGAGLRCMHMGNARRIVECLDLDLSSVVPGRLTRSLVPAASLGPT